MSAQRAMKAGERDLLVALFDFVSQSRCRAANTAERKMLAEGYAAMGEKYAPLLRQRGLDPSQISHLEMEEIARGSAS